ncbi:hypothetical protein AAMO2058_001509400 [Amorphochlora amoebiformis]
MTAMRWALLLLLAQIGRGLRQTKPVSLESSSSIPSVSLATPVFGDFNIRNVEVSMVKNMMRSKYGGDMEFIIVHVAPEPSKYLSLLTSKGPLSTSPLRQVRYYHLTPKKETDFVGHLRNGILQLAKHDIIFNLDADDFYLSGYVSRMVQELTRRDLQNVALTVCKPYTSIGLGVHEIHSENYLISTHRNTREHNKARQTFYFITPGSNDRKKVNETTRQTEPFFDPKKTPALSLIDQNENKQTTYQRCMKSFFKSVPGYCQAILKSVWENGSDLSFPYFNPGVGAVSNYKGVNKSDPLVIKLVWDASLTKSFWYHVNVSSGERKKLGRNLVKFMSLLDFALSGTFEDGSFNDNQRQKVLAESESLIDKDDIRHFWCAFSPSSHQSFFSQLRHEIVPAFNSSMRCQEN